MQDQENLVRLNPMGVDIAAAGHDSAPRWNRGSRGSHMPARYPKPQQLFLGLANQIKW